MVVLVVDGVIVVALVEGDVALAGVVVEGRVGGSVALAAAEDVAVQPLLRVPEGEEVADVLHPTCARVGGLRGAEGRGYFGLAEPVGVPRARARQF